MNNKELLLQLKKGIDLYIKENYVPKDYHEIRFSIAESPRDGEEDLCLESALPNRNLDDVLEHINDTFQQAMFYHIDSKHLDEVKVYNDAHIDRRLFSKIRSNKDFKPSKKTAICLCMGLKLNLDETNDLLEKAGYTLSHSSKADLIVEYFITIKEYNLDILNQVLYDYGEDILYV